ncbi:hypothetical protein K3495_g14440 [Podosphaera aphanis]|nr:hypothetical protein K3495_g14440 [Podosphaera aphanis]
MEKESSRDALVRIGITTGSLETKIQKFKESLFNIPSSVILVYSDGSNLEDKRSGAGYVIFQFGLQVREEALPLAKQKEVEDAEVLAALKGIHAAISLPSARFSNDIWIFLDNQEVARKLLSISDTAISQAAYLDA